MLINYEYPPLGGGAGRATRSLAKYFVDWGIDVTILTSRYRDQLRRELDNGVTFSRVPTVRLYQEKSNVMEMTTFMVAGACLVPKIVREFQPQATICYFGIPGGPAAMMAKRLFDIPYIVSLRGGDVPGFQTGHIELYYKLTNPLTKHIWNKASSVVANSNGLRDLALETAPQLPIRVIPNGVDLDRFSPAKKRRRKEAFVEILFVGRLAKQKGLDTLWHALARLNNAGTTNFRLRLAGGGPEQYHLDQSAKKLGISSRIEFLGWQPGERIRELYREAKIFVLPSIDEGMPNALMEAMASEVAVVATDVSGSREIITNRKDGLLVPIGDDVALAETLEELIVDDGKCKRLGRAARKSISAFSLKSVAESYLELLEQSL